MATALTRSDTGINITVDKTSGQYVDNVSIWSSCNEIKLLDTLDK